MSNLTEAKFDESKLNAFVGQMLADLGGASSVALVRLGVELLRLPRAEHNHRQGPVRRRTAPP